MNKQKENISGVNNKQMQLKKTDWQYLSIFFALNMLNVEYVSAMVYR